jgi:hypothetical protein
MKKSDAIRFRCVIEHAAQSLDDNTALTAPSLLPEWTSSTDYTQGYKVQMNGKLWRCLQAHTAQDGWEPGIAASLWDQINEVSSGTLGDPIPYSGNMVLSAGLHYIQGGVVYRCTRDTVNPVYNSLADLVGLYVEEV